MLNLFKENTKKNTNVSEELITFLKSYIEKLEQGVLSENERLGLLRLYLTNIPNEDGVEDKVEDEDKDEEQRLENYLFLGWWFSQHLQTN